MPEQHLTAVLADTAPKNHIRLWLIPNKRLASLTSWKEPVHASRFTEIRIMTAQSQPNDVLNH